MLKKSISVLLAIVMSITFCSASFAVKYPGGTDVSAIALTYDLSNVTQKDIYEARAAGLKIINKITDPVRIQALVDTGEVELSRSGELPLSVTTYATVAAEIPKEKLQIQSAAALDSITISKYDWYDGRYFEEYDRYEIDGPSEFTQTYSRTSTCGWNTSMSSSVTVGGKVYGVAEVKAALEGSVSYSIGESITKTSNYRVDIPSGKYWVIKVWTSYRAFSYSAKVGTTTLCTGKSWYPNGLIIRHTEYFF